ncbi:hypothetical protein [Bacillus phage SDFMU_Pbc]|uniref:Uncharacterized protein n=1 Tax=Bacillus phage SDFMU_Pbc TaxID=3076135 RepID=A0AA96R5J4_9CAUD|nr:hypothetical protein [Bacillus phage SDFMU_Pbc]
MKINENKYHSTVKLEFRDLIGTFINTDRSIFHMYSIHRLLHLGVLVDFTYEYCKNTTDDKFIEVKLDLKEFGLAYFKIDTDSNYGSIADEESRKVLESFYVSYDTELGDAKRQGII